MTGTVSDFCLPTCGVDIWTKAGGFMAFNQCEIRYSKMWKDRHIESISTNYERENVKDTAIFCDIWWKSSNKKQH